MKLNHNFDPTPDEFRFGHSLGDVEKAAGVFLDRNAQPGMFDRLDWFKLTAKHSLEGEPLVVHSVGGTGQAWLFLDREGASAAPLSNWHCLCFAPVIYGEPDREVMGGLVKRLLKAGITHLRLDPLRHDPVLPSIMREQGWLVRYEQVNEHWYVDTTGMTFEDYWATRASRLRNTAKRKAKKTKLEYKIFDRFCPEAWNDTQSVFAASWKNPDDKPALLREIMRHEGRAGTLRLGLAYQDGLAVAAQIWTVENGTALIHQLAYREDKKELSAGTLLSVELFKHVLDVDRVNCIDFGLGNDAYKREWMSDCAPLYMLTAYYPYRWSGALGLLKVAANKALRAAGLRDEPVNFRDQSRQ